MREKPAVVYPASQYKASKAQKRLCIHTDPVNPTFHGYKALTVKRFEILEGNETNPRKFDTVVELVVHQTTVRSDRVYYKSAARCPI